MEAKTATPTQAKGCALQLCDGSTGHFVANVAFCDTPERAEAIVRACNSFDDLVDELCAALPFLEDCLTDHGYKPGAVANRIKSIRAALLKAGAI